MTAELLESGRDTHVPAQGRDLDALLTCVLCSSARSLTRLRMSAKGSTLQIANYARGGPGSWHLEWYAKYPLQAHPVTPTAPLVVALPGHLSDLETRPLAFTEVV